MEENYMIFRHGVSTGAATATRKLSLKEIRMEKFEFPLTRHPGEIQCWFDNSWKEKCKAKGELYYWVADAADPDDRKQAGELFRKQMINLAELNGTLDSLEAFGPDFEDAEFQRLLGEIRKTRAELQKLKEQSEKLTTEEKNIGQVLNELDDPSLTDKVFEEAKKKAYAAELLRTKVAVYERQLHSLSTKAVVALSEHRDKEYEKKKRIGDQMADRINARLQEDQKLIDEFIAYIPTIAALSPSDRPLASTIQYSTTLGSDNSMILQTLGLGRIAVKPSCYEFIIREDSTRSSVRSGETAPGILTKVG
jgi:hypothetical protein